MGANAARLPTIGGWSRHHGRENQKAYSSAILVSPNEMALWMSIATVSPFS
jgi:hypothetical protein